VRLPQVHNPFKQGLITYLIAVAREKGVSAYVGDGLNRWPAVHVLDAASVYRLALEKSVAGARYNAVAEEGIPLREIAESVGAASNCRWSPNRPRKQPSTLDGSALSPAPTYLPPAPSPSSAWAGAQPTLASSPIWTRPNSEA